MVWCEVFSFDDKEVFVRPPHDDNEVFVRPPPSGATEEEEEQRDFLEEYGEDAALSREAFRRATHAEATRCGMGPLSFIMKVINYVFV